MAYFLDTIETIPDGVGFVHFGPVHIAWLLLAVVICVINCVLYRRLSRNGQKRWRITISLLILLDEIFKTIMLVIGGRYTPEYLPLHLCSLNIIVIAIHCIRPTSLLSGYLYTVCIPGAAAALLFPSWTPLPVGNFMHMHSFSVHILLLMYPLALSVSGELAPSIKKLHWYMLLLVFFAVPIACLNLILDTNFMFLMYADAGNPLYIFKEMWGSHLYGFPIAVLCILIIMYVPLVIYRKRRGREV